MTSANRRAETGTQTLASTTADLTTLTATSPPSQTTVTTLNVTTMEMTTPAPESKILYVWVPYAFFLLGIFIVLTASFIQRWKRVLKRRRVLMDYIEADVLAKRPRIFRIFSQSGARTNDRPFDCSRSACCWDRNHRPVFGSPDFPAPTPNCRHREGGEGGEGNGQFSGPAQSGEGRVVLGVDTDGSGALSSSTSSAVPTFCQIFYEGEGRYSFGKYPSHDVAGCLHKESGEGHCCGLGAGHSVSQGHPRLFQNGLNGQRNFAFSCDEDNTSRCCAQHALRPLHLQPPMGEVGAREGGEEREDGVDSVNYPACPLQQHTYLMSGRRERALHHDGRNKTTGHHINPDAMDNLSCSERSNACNGGGSQQTHSRGYHHPPQPHSCREASLWTMEAYPAGHTERCSHCGSTRGPAMSVEATTTVTRGYNTHATEVTARQSVCSSPINTLKTIAITPTTDTNFFSPIPSGFSKNICESQSTPDETGIAGSIQLRATSRGSHSISVDNQRGSWSSATPREETESGSTQYTTLTLSSVRSKEKSGGPPRRAASAGPSVERTVLDVYTIELNHRDPPTDVHSEYARTRRITDEPLRRSTSAGYLPSRRQITPQQMHPTATPRSATRRSTQPWALKRKQFSNTAMTTASLASTTTSSTEISLTIPARVSTLSLPTSERSIFWLSSAGSDMEQTIV